MNEIWKDLNEIDAFSGYQVSSLGRVRCSRNFRGEITSSYRILKPCMNKDGYLELTIYNNDHKKCTKRVHKLVANVFHGQHPDLVVNHIDGNKLNNSSNNLEYVTATTNSTLAARDGLYKTKAIRIKETGEEFDSIKNCADKLDLHPSNISHAIIGDKKTDSVKGLHFELIDKSKNQKKQPFLYDFQMDAVNRAFNGCIFNGQVGSGKSRTGLYYYFKEQGGSIDPDYIPMKNPKDLYIITTAMKRDSLEWEGELANFLISKNPEVSYYKNKVVIDSWNNIKKYKDVYGAFFIFDEDRVTGKGIWAKTFLNIARKNKWIILSATPGDTFEQYIPVFIANGFYKNKSEFTREHCVYSQYTRYPKIERYLNTSKLIRLRDKILIDMDDMRHTIPHHEDIYVKYDILKYKEATKTRWDPFKNEPIQQASGLCYVLRRIVNEDESRQVALLEILEKHRKAIIFYNFDYELELLRSICNDGKRKIAEWNGHNHQPVPNGKNWVYLVQYTAGAEGWNCITTDTIIFYSQNYSYKVVTQAAGRIDRLNTNYIDLYYYHLKSRSGIDLAISKALMEKRQFNESRWVKW